jgi:D-sedoheptulose 7-phosphate isomerase
MVDVKKTIEACSLTVGGLLDNSQRISEIVQAVVACLREGKKLLVFGNGGSATQAQHLSAELVVRVSEKRQARPAIALTVDSATLTAAANDFGFDHVFSRQIEALASPGDIGLALSTSGNSENIVCGLKRARDEALSTIALLGKDGGKAKGLADLELIVESNDTQRIQEAHLLILHIIAESVEDDLASQ